MDYEELKKHSKYLEWENGKLKELCKQMFKEHQTIYHQSGVLRMGKSATGKQMANWYGECRKFGVEID